MKRAPYNPFKYDTGKVHHVIATWDIVSTDDEIGAMKALARFRRGHPDLGKTPPSDLTWGYAWSEDPVLLDMDRPAEERVNAREAKVRTVVIFCRVEDGAETYSRDLPGLTPFLRGTLFDEEVARMSAADWLPGEEAGSG